MRATDLVGSRLTPPGLLLQDVHPAPASVAALREGPAARRRPRQAAEEAGRAGVADRVPPPPRRRSGDRRRASRAWRPRCKPPSWAPMSFSSTTARSSADRCSPAIWPARRKELAARVARGRGRDPRAGGRDRLVRRARAGLVRQHAASDPGRRPHHRDRLDRAAPDVRGQRPPRGDAVLRRRAARVALRRPARETRGDRDHHRSRRSSPRSPCTTLGSPSLGSPTPAPRGPTRSSRRGWSGQGIPLLRGTVVVRAFGRKRVKGAVVATLGERRPAGRGHRSRHRLRPGRGLRRERPVGLAAPPGRRQGALGRGRRRIRAR